MPGIINCNTTANTRMAETKPPVAGTVSGRNTFSSEISARSRTLRRRLRKSCVGTDWAAATRMRTAEISGRQAARNARQTTPQFPETFRALRGRTAAFQMLTNVHTFVGPRAAGDRVVDVARQLGSNCSALHGIPLAEPSRKNLLRAAKFVGVSRLMAQTPDAASCWSQSASQMRGHCYAQPQSSFFHARTLSGLFHARPLSGPFHARPQSGRQAAARANL